MMNERDSCMMNTINQQAKELIGEHLTCWELARVNYAALEKVQTRVLEVNGYPVILQFNPERIRSSAAKIDKQSLAARPCFLCEAHRPGNQRWIDFGEEYQILVNPFPIFREHLTIPVRAHQEQCISTRYKDMLLLAEALTDFIVFYNGPRCGASAPDHMHFQAGSKGLLPIETNRRRAKREIVLSSGRATLYALRDFLQPMFVIESGNQEDAIYLFNHLYTLPAIGPDECEPMMNVLTWTEHGQWITCIYPRKKLHPSCYYAEGDANLLISPATVEMAGVFITPLEKDFRKVTAADLQQIIKETCLSEKEIDQLIRKSKSRTV